MRYLTVQEVLYIHNYVIEQTGGSHGVHDIGLLESAVARAQATYGGEELYAGVFAKAAALLESLALNHAFVDGNKRTAITSAAEFLFWNGWNLDAQNRELEDYVVALVVQHPPIDDIAAWLEKRCKRVPT